jgi:hypothetical protein
VPGDIFTAGPDMKVNVQADDIVLEDVNPEETSWSCLSILKLLRKTDDNRKVFGHFHCGDITLTG